MKTDIQGCSTCPSGHERHEYFTSTLFEGARIQYDYRSTSGKLFSCVAKTLKDARERRDKWLEIQGVSI